MRRPPGRPARAGFAFALLACATACSVLTGVGSLHETDCPAGCADGAPLPAESAVDAASDASSVDPPAEDAPADDAVAVVDAGKDAAHAQDATHDGPPPFSDAAPTGYGAVVRDDGPLAYWRMNETSGMVAHDSSGHGNNAAFSNCTLGAPGPLLNEPSLAAGFDGATSFVSGPNFAFVGIAAFSIEGWANATAFTSVSYHHLLNEETQGGNRQGYAIFVNESAQLGFERFVDASNSIADGPAFSIAQFHHVVGTYDGATLTLYLDGVVVATAADARTSVGTMDPFYVGAAETTKFFSGVMGEVAIYDHALPAARVSAHYHASGR